MNHTNLNGIGVICKAEISESEPAENGVKKFAAVGFDDLRLFLHIEADRAVVERQVVIQILGTFNNYRLTLVAASDYGIAGNIFFNSVNGEVAEIFYKLGNENFRNLIRRAVLNIIFGFRRCSLKRFLAVRKIAVNGIPFAVKISEIKRFAVEEIGFFKISP